MKWLNFGGKISREKEIGTVTLAVRVGIEGFCSHKYLSWVWTWILWFISCTGTGITLWQSHGIARDKRRKWMSNLWWIWSGTSDTGIRRVGFKFKSHRSGLAGVQMRRIDNKAARCSRFNWSYHISGAYMRWVFILCSGTLRAASRPSALCQCRCMRSIWTPLGRVLKVWSLFEISKVAHSPIIGHEATSR